MTAPQIAGLHRLQNDCDVQLNCSVMSCALPCHLWIIPSNCNCNFWFSQPLLILASHTPICWRYYRGIYSIFRV